MKVVVTDTYFCLRWWNWIGIVPIQKCYLIEKEKNGILCCFASCWLCRRRFKVKFATLCIFLQLKNMGLELAFLDTVRKKIVFLFFIFVTNSFFWTSFGTFDTNLSKVTPHQSSWLHACRSYNGVLYYVVVLRCLSGSQKKGWRTDKVYRNDFEPYLMPAGNSKHCHLKMHLQPTKCHFPDVTVSRYWLQFSKKNLFIRVWLLSPSSEANQQSWIFTLQKMFYVQKNKH